MAGRVNLYILFRQIHFYSGAFLLVFLLLFFVTGYLLTQHDWFDHPEPVQEITSHSLPVPGFEEESEKIDWLRSQYSIVGKSNPVRQSEDGSWHVDFISPRHTIKVHVFPLSDSLSIEKTQHPPYRTLVVLHRMHNYGGGWFYNIYLFFMDMVSISLLIFSATGIYLWWKLIPSKWLGAALLVAGLGYVAGVIITFLW
ncbi:MAG: PepSY-associated TM helix domain-containing protein [Bacteroidia bacterium]|nr:PepSY-associated TM helix domain-containing protein [Bacteroidia bacterium]